MGSSLSEIYLYLKDGEGKHHSETISIQLTAIEERKNITYLKIFYSYIWISCKKCFIRIVLK